MIVQDNAQCHERSRAKGLKLPFRFLFAPIKGDTESCLKTPGVLTGMSCTENGV